MASKKSVAAVIQENEYWIRLGTFLHDPLKYALFQVLHNAANDATYVGLPEDPILLYQELSKRVRQITQLVKKRVLQQDQVDLLLPPNDNKTDSSKFDVTLIVILIINFTTLKPPINGWKDKNPPPHDRSKGAGVIRGRQWRNFVHHTEPKDIDQAKFNQKWAEATQIINDLAYHYDANKLKAISLDPKHEVVLKSLLLLIANMKIKHDTLEANHDTLKLKHNALEIEHDSLQTKHDVLQAKHDTSFFDLTQQLHELENEVQHLNVEVKRKEQSDTASTGTCCLKSVLEYIFKEINEEEAQELLAQLDVQTEGDLVDSLKNVPWKSIKIKLEEMCRGDVVEHIRKNTLINCGLQNASNKLRHHYINELIECLVEQPLSSVEMDSHYAQREDAFIDLVVLPSSTVDEEYSNSDRDALIKQILMNKSSTENAVDKIIKPDDELTFIRGIAGIGKSTLIDMFTLKWAKKELSNSSLFDFVFKFTCRELNQILNVETTLEQLFQLQFPNIFCGLTLEDLSEVSADRILIIVDGLDELKDIYQMDDKSASSLDPSPLLQVIHDLINPKSKPVKPLDNHKTIVCGRPKACELLKSQFFKTFKIKTIEVCGFNRTSVKQYVFSFFRNNQEKARLVHDIIESSYNLKVMSTVPVFLWVICNVYNEDLIKSPITTNTELYLYTCLIFLRNHFQGYPNNYKNLLDIVNDQNIIDTVYSLMVLSVKTYMQNQVLFTDEDIKKLKCPVHLEQTGFIVKYCRSNLTESTYQFRHLILQEFLCAMYLCVTKGISPFLSNRELSSCLPTIYGIQRIIQEKENDIFLHFYRALRKSNDKVSTFFVKLTSPIRSRSYSIFLKKNIFKLPPCMIEDKTLYINDNETDCREILDTFKEANNKVYKPLMEDAEITLAFYKDFRNIWNLLQKLNITKIRKFDIRTTEDFFGHIDENILRLCEMTVEFPTETVIVNHFFKGWRMQCTRNRLEIRLNKSALSVSMKNLLTLLDKLHIKDIHEFDISYDFFDVLGNIDESILRLYKMTAGPSMRIDVSFDLNRSSGWMQCTVEKLSLSLGRKELVNVKNVLHLLEKLEIRKIQVFDIKCNDLFDENGNINRNILRLSEMTAGSSMEVFIQLSSLRKDDEIRCTDKGLCLYSYEPLLSLISFAGIIKTTTTKFHIIIDDDKLLCFPHSPVAVFLKELTKYAMEHSKDIFISSPLTSLSSIKAILKDGNVEDVENKYLHLSEFKAKTDI